jgi:hypothetical protein
VQLCLLLAIMRSCGIRSARYLRTLGDFRAFFAVAQANFTAYRKHSRSSHYSMVVGCPTQLTRHLRNSNVYLREIGCVFCCVRNCTMTCQQCHKKNPVAAAITSHCMCPIRHCRCVPKPSQPPRHRHFSAFRATRALCFPLKPSVSSYAQHHAVELAVWL